MNILDWFKNMGMSTILDIAIMAFLIYAVLVWFKRTRAAFVLTGIFIVFTLYLVTRAFNLTLTSAILEKFFAVILIALVVIFQEELRQFFEQVAVWSLNRRIVLRRTTFTPREEVQTLVRTTSDLAREKIGALIVLRGQDIIARHLEGGNNLYGELSEPLLKSLFDPHSIGHDGAVIIDKNRVTQFSCYLPLSKNLKKIGSRGTRHAAALGLSERSDAICLVVSEERGTISVAQNGNMEIIPDPESLGAILEKFYQGIAPRKEVKPFRDFFRKNSREKVTAIFLAVTVWFVFDHSSKLIFKNYTIPVDLSNQPGPWIVNKFDPSEIEVTFQGPRKAFYFLREEEIVFSPHLKLRKGSQIRKITSKDLIFPETITLEMIEPGELKVQIEKKEPIKEDFKLR